MDAFLNVKNVSRDDMLSAHQALPKIMGMIPNNTSGFGDLEKANRVFVRNEPSPRRNVLKKPTND